MRKFVLASLFVALLGSFVFASDPKSSVAFMPLEAVRPGMKGYGLTVFQGTTPERFEVEVLGVVDGMPSPKMSVIIARLSGAQVERTSVFAGMSGSPVYIDGKLVGAVAYAFPFAKEPIAGITPIKDMIDIFEQGADAEPSAPRPVSFNTLMARAEANISQLPGPRAATIGPRAAANPAMAAVVGQTIRPIATPVTFSGVPQHVVDMFAEDLRKVGIEPIAGIGGGSKLGPMVPASEDTLAPGSSVSVELARGDFALDAAGTVTHRDGRRVYAFGHPFLGSGSTSWPMAENSVVTVVPNVNNSFKLSNGGNLVGAISQDRTTGVYGELGQLPRMIPVKLNVRTSRNKLETYNFEVVSDSFLTPLLMRIAMFSAITATERQVGSQTLTLNGRIAINGQPDIVLDNSFSSLGGAAMFAVAAVERPIAVLLASGFEAVDIKAVEIDVTSTDSRSGGTLSRLWIDKTEVRRGEMVEIQAFARHDNGSEFVERIPLQIPADAPAGPLVILVGDGASINQTETRVQAGGGDFTPKDLGQLVRAINRLKKNNRLYVKVLRSGTGAIVNNEEMPTLPPSVMATLGSERTAGGYAPLQVSTLLEQELAPSQFIISGQQAITINVVK